MAKGFNHKGLQIKKPNRKNCHYRNLQTEQKPRFAISFQGKYRQQNCRQISQTAKRGKRHIFNKRNSFKKRKNSAERCIFARQNLFATCYNAARNGFGGVMMNRQINRVAQANQGNKNRQKRKFSDFFA